MDSKFGPDGALYIQVYDGFFRANPNVGLYKYEYIGGPDTPGPDPQATPVGGRRVTFAIGRSGGVSYRWDFGDGTSSTAEAVTHRYAAAGTYDVTLTVTYADGEQESDTIQVTVS
jgi:PKD repeat protein